MAAEIERSSLDNSYESKLATENKNKDDVPKVGAKDAKEKVKPLVKKEDVVSTKKGFFTKIKESFISEDAKDIGDYIVNDVVIPGIKDTILSCIERAFGYSGRGYRRNERADTRERTSYSSYYRSSRSERDRRRERDERREERRDELDYKNIVLKNREDAEEIADKMNYYIHEYDSVAVAMLFDLIDMPSKYTDNNWGWTREGDIRVRRVRTGWLIDVPEAEYLGD